MTIEFNHGGAMSVKSGTGFTGTKAYTASNIIQQDKIKKKIFPSLSGEVKGRGCPLTGQQPKSTVISSDSERPKSTVISRVTGKHQRVQ